MVAKLLVLSALFALGCSSSPLPTGELVKIPTESYWRFADLEQIEPKTEYREWFEEVASCLDQTTDFEKIYWYAASKIRDPNRLPVISLYWAQDEKPVIVLTEQDEDSVKHELAHFILRQNEDEMERPVHHQMPLFWACIRVED